uniref:Uncharacterized protein n=1 Tax=Chromera velia CCMP2878 TaxID=1169474 RepID=A0A0G4IBA0_9ALVE|eukprot:Cvel_2172.t1-p1 / transcript=Cvel_2172.t1 / gene=Cvel_2172 / organism=Chromera_velia_CCMP2878 / gene_product=hypothetical protein / transcript_product=hypothetical protein / location=Cvel_scaffold84:49754-56326(+) / protein_length=235 / sequence_SO=supercontig / SO=protein_coding / is_pseudo=false
MGVAPSFTLRVTVVLACRNEERLMQPLLYLESVINIYGSKERRLIEALAACHCEKKKTNVFRYSRAHSGSTFTFSSVAGREGSSNTLSSPKEKIESESEVIDERASAVLLSVMRKREEPGSRAIGIRRGLAFFGYLSRSNCRLFLLSPSAKKCCQTSSLTNAHVKLPMAAAALCVVRSDRAGLTLLSLGIRESLGGCDGAGVAPDLGTNSITSPWGWNSGSDAAGGADGESGTAC